MPFSRVFLKRSPCFCNLEGIFLIVKSEGFRDFVTSFQSSGVETGASGLGRTE